MNVEGSPEVRLGVAWGGVNNCIAVKGFERDIASVCTVAFERTAIFS